MIKDIDKYIASLKDKSEASLKNVINNNKAHMQKHEAKADHYGHIMKEAQKALKAKQEHFVEVACEFSHDGKCYYEAYGPKGYTQMMHKTPYYRLTEVYNVPFYLKITRRAIDSTNEVEHWAIYQTWFGHTERRIKCDTEFDAKAMVLGFLKMYEVE